MTRRNLDMYRGDTYAFEVTVENAGSSIDITDFDFRMTAKYDISDSDSDCVFSITSPSSILKTSPSQGLILVTIPVSATENLTRGLTYILPYDIQMSSGPGTIYTICSGLLTVYPDCSITVP